MLNVIIAKICASYEAAVIEAALREVIARVFKNLNTLQERYDRVSQYDWLCQYYVNASSRSIFRVAKKYDIRPRDLRKVIEDRYPQGLVKLYESIY